MLSKEEFFVLKNSFGQGISISEIARQTGYSRKTIRKYVTSSRPPAPKKRAKRVSKLDGYREFIISRLQEYPISAKCIYNEIQAMGFNGTYTIVRDFVREINQRRVNLAGSQELCAQ
jgi:transposase